MAIDHPCPLCGHSLVGHQIGSRCPECALLIVPGAAITRPRELFIVGIRLIGVWYLVGIVKWILGIINVLRTGTTSFTLIDPQIEEYGLWVLAYLAVGLYCLFGAPHLVGMTYGHRLARETAPARTDPADKSD